METETKYIDSDLCVRDFDLYLSLKLILLRNDVVDCVKINSTEFLDYNTFDKLIKRIKEINETCPFDDKLYLIPMNLSIMICTYKKWFKQDIYLNFSGCIDRRGISNVDMFYIYGILTPKNLKKGKNNTKIFINFPNKSSIVIHTMFISDSTVENLKGFLENLKNIIDNDEKIPRGAKLGIYINKEFMFETFIRPKPDAKMYFDEEYVDKCEKHYINAEQKNINYKIASTAPLIVLKR